jgi:hypothetical protein
MDLLQQAQQKKKQKEEKPKAKTKKQSGSLSIGGKKSRSKSKPKTTHYKPKKKGRIFGFFGDEGTGKTYASVNLAKKFGKTLILDLEYKADEVIDERYNELKYNIKRPIVDDEKKISDVFEDDADIHILVVRKINKQTGKTDPVKTTKYLMELTPKVVHFIKSGKYKCVIIDSMIPIKKYAKKEWLNRNPKRTRPNKFEYSEVEAIKQDILMPFINIGKVYGVNIILTGGIKGHYVADTKIGYKQDAKAWLLGILTYELWCSRDYWKYAIKHPYKPFWAIQDEGLNISEYLFDPEFIEQYAEFKEFQDFKYERMTSKAFREDRKEIQKLKIGKKGE